MKYTCLLWTGKEIIDKNYLPTDSICYIWTSRSETLQYFSLVVLASWF